MKRGHHFTTESTANDEYQLVISGALFDILLAFFFVVKCLQIINNEFQFLLYIAIRLVVDVGIEPDKAEEINRMGLFSKSPISLSISVDNTTSIRNTLHILSISHRLRDSNNLFFTSPSIVGLYLMVHYYRCRREPHRFL